ncbi:MAG: acyl carrier protein [Gemmatimonadota bacterium]|nr:acyl carrier protein [Gemmatimonadota bacterium]MDH5284708.1 acyl carrier protein [Gemmatimonadota bacterium]
MNRADQRAVLLRFLESIRKPDRPLNDLSDDDHLIQSGLIDSLAVLEIVAFLEQEFGVDFAEGGIDPSRLATINRILDLVAQQRA